MVHALRALHSLLPSSCTDEYRRAFSWAWTIRLGTSSLATVTTTRPRRSSVPVHGATCTPQPGRGAALPVASLVYTFDPVEPGANRDLVVPSDPCVLLVSYEPIFSLP